eukprot:4426256-Amphidinium_carterae.1
MVAELRLTEGGETIVNEDEQSRENNLINENEIDENKKVTLHVHMTSDNTIAMMGKMNIKLPTPTQFDGKNLQFNEWAGEVKTYLTTHNVHFEDYMDNCTNSIDVVHISDIQDNYTAEDYIKLNNKFPAVPAEDTDEYEEYNEMRMISERRKTTLLASIRQ